MSKATTYRNECLQHVFNNTAVSGIGDGPGLQPSATPGSLYVGLHPAYPGAGGDQTTNAATYPGYARKAVARTVGGWTVVGNNASNTALVQFDPATGGSETVFYATIGTALTGAGKILYNVPLGVRLGVAIVESADLAGNDITAPEHLLAADDRVAFFAPDGESLPTGLTEGTVYYVLSAGLTADTFNVSLTSGGAEVGISAVGQARLHRMTGLAVSAGITPEFAIGALDVYEA